MYIHILTILTRVNSWGGRSATTTIVVAKSTVHMMGAQLITEIRLW